MKEKVFCPSQKSENVIIEYTDDFILDKKSKIYVPNQYKAIVFDNEKIAFRVDSTAEKIIYKECGKEFENPNSFNGHKSSCKIHQIKKYGSLEFLNVKYYNQAKKISQTLKKKGQCKKEKSLAN